MEIERTDIARMEFYGLTVNSVPDVAGRDASPTEIRTRAILHLVQQIEQDPEYPTYPPHTQEDYMLDRLYEIDEENGLPYNVDPHDLFMTWISKRRPDTKVIYLGETVSKPFYE